MIPSVELQHRFFEASMAFVEQAALYLFPGKVGDMPEWVASATGFVTPSGRPFVLTAAHNLEDGFENISIGGYRLTGAVSNFIQAPPVMCPKAVGADLAVILPSSVPPALLDRFLPTSLLDFEGHAPDETGLGCVAVGYPSALWRTMAGPTENLMYLLFSPIVYGCYVSERDPVRNRYVFDWGKGEITEETRERFAPLGLADAQFPPPGVSGGPLWHFSPSPDGALWSPQRNGRIVGVMTAWREAQHVQIAEASSNYGPWLKSVTESL